jgi:hypothetical protein
MRARLKTPVPSSNVVTIYALIFKTVFSNNIARTFCPSGHKRHIGSKSTLLLSSLLYLFAGLTVVSSDYITSWITIRARVAWMYAKELNHVVRRVVVELITTLLQMAVL